MNGVILNGAKISPCQPCKVKIGDIIEIGKPIDETIMQSLKTSDVFIFRVKVSSFQVAVIIFAQNVNPIKDL